MDRMKDTKIMHRRHRLKKMFWKTQKTEGKRKVDLRERKYGSWWPVEVDQDLGLGIVDLQGFTTGALVQYNLDSSRCAGPRLSRITKKPGLQGLRQLKCTLLCF
jgi:hypothetical protein